MGGLEEAWVHLGEGEGYFCTFHLHVHPRVWVCVYVCDSVCAHVLPLLKTLKPRDFPHDLVAKTPHSQCRGSGFDPWSWN